MNKTIKKLLSTSVLSLLLVTGVSSKAHATDYMYYGQDVTAQVAAPGTLMASGKPVNYLYVAVHPKYWGSHSTPIFPFGTYIQPTEPIISPFGTQWTIFQVQDIGDVNNTEGLTKFWFEVYWGDESYRESAYQFGKKTRNYKVSY
jgi:hypothetical protein